jgi:hypothetical protein
MFEIDPNNPFDIGDPDTIKVVAIFALIAGLVGLGVHFL